MAVVALNGSNGLVGRSIKAELISSNHRVHCIHDRLPYNEDCMSSLAQCDVFINNVACGFEQVNVLQQIYERWRMDESKWIINIGSRAAAKNVSLGFGYSTAKAALAHFSELVTFRDQKKRCRLTTINPGLIEKLENASLKASDIASAVSWLIGQPDYIEVSRLDLHHRMPYHKLQQLKSRLNGYEKC